jgi:integrase/predicted nucleic acid-binding Zn ribbon protein
MMAGAYKLEELPRNKKGYGFKAQIPGVSAQTFRASTKSEAKAKAMQHINDVQSGKVRTSPEITLSEYRAEIAPIAKWAPDTRRNNDWLWTRLIAPRFGDDPLSAIQRPQIRSWISDLEQSGVTGPRRHQALIHLKAMLNSAKADDRIVGVPVTTGLAVHPDDRVGHALTPDQAVLLSTEIGQRYGAVVLLGATTGLRIGELLALKPDDVDERQLVIHVRRSARGGAQGKSNITIGPGKTPAAKRDVPINQAHVKLIREHRAQFGLSPEGYLFTNTLGEWLVYQTFRQVFHRTVKRIVKTLPDFPLVRIHDLRKTTGRYLLDNRDLNPKDVARIMGHADVAMTYRAYSPLIPGDKSLPAHQADMAKRFELPGADKPETAIEPWMPPDAPRFVTPTKTCPGCGKEFVPVHRRKVTCSPACQWIRQNEQSRVRSQRVRDSRTVADVGLLAMGVLAAPSKNGAIAYAAVERWSDPIESARWGG